MPGAAPPGLTRAGVSRYAYRMGWKEEEIAKDAPVEPCAYCGAGHTSEHHAEEYDRLVSLLRPIDDEDPGSWRPAWSATRCRR